MVKYDLNIDFFRFGKYYVLYKQKVFTYIGVFPTVLVTCTYHQLFDVAKHQKTVLRDYEKSLFFILFSAYSKTAQLTSYFSKFVKLRLTRYSGWQNDESHSILNKPCFQHETF